MDCSAAAPLVSAADILADAKVAEEVAVMEQERQTLYDAQVESDAEWAEADSEVFNPDIPVGLPLDEALAALQQGFDDHEQQLNHYMQRLWDHNHRKGARLLQIRDLDMRIRRSKPG